MTNFKSNDRAEPEAANHVNIARHSARGQLSDRPRSESVASRNNNGMLVL